MKAMSIHSRYWRKIKETGAEIEIMVVWCRKCKKWHAVLPDFLLPDKHYSGNEIESVIIDSGATGIKQIETDASEATVRRWIKQIGERVTRAICILKYIFGVSETSIKTGAAYSELEQVLENAPSGLKYSGNKLGLANLLMGTYAIKEYI